MKEENNLDPKKTFGKSDSDESSSYKTNKTKEEVKFKVKSIEEPPLVYFSSPCMLSELENNEDIQNL